MRPEFFACGSHKVIAPARAPVCHQFIFLNISEKTALQTLQASWKCLLLQAAIFTLMYFQLFYITHSVDTFCSLWTRSSKALCTVAQHVHPQFWVKFIPAILPVFYFRTNMKANTVFCLQTSWASTKEMKEIKSSAEWLRSRLHQPSSSMMDSALRSPGKEVKIKL